MHDVILFPLMYSKYVMLSGSLFYTYNWPKKPASKNNLCAFQGNRLATQMYWAQPVALRVGHVVGELACFTFRIIYNTGSLTHAHTGGTCIPGYFPT